MRFALISLIKKENFMAQTSSMENIARKSHLDSDIQHREREIAQNVPPSLFVTFALGSMLVSASLAIFAKQKEIANFIGLWAPSFLLIGVYNKLTRLEVQDEHHPVQRVA